MHLVLSEYNTGDLIKMRLDDLKVWVFLLVLACFKSKKQSYCLNTFSYDFAAASKKKNLQNLQIRTVGFMCW